MTRLSGLLDKQEDRVDVYRIVIPARPLGHGLGDPALRRPVARGLLLHGGLDQRPRRPDRPLAACAASKRTERVTIVNPDAESHSYYVTVRPQGSSRYQEREYTLRVGYRACRCP